MKTRTLAALLALPWLVSSCTLFAPLEDEVSGEDMSADAEDMLSAGDMNSLSDMQPPDEDMAPSSEDMSSGEDMSKPADMPPAVEDMGGEASCAGVVCEALDDCHLAGVCDPMTGECTNPLKPDGSACNDGNRCTRSDTCQRGVCRGADPIMCPAVSQCHLPGTCDPETGRCNTPFKPDSALCDDGDACTRTDVCISGVCMGTNPVTCQTAPCQTSSCDSSSGTCSQPTARPNGTACNDGLSCSLMDQCVAGVCRGTPPTFIDQSQPNSNLTLSSRDVAQSFRPSSSGELVGISLKRSGISPPSYQLDVRIYLGEARTGSPIYNATVTLPSQSGMATIDLPGGPTLQANTQYSFTLKTAPDEPTLSFQVADTNPYSGGRLFYQSPYGDISHNDLDLAFEILMVQPCP